MVIIQDGQCGGCVFWEGDMSNTHKVLVEKLEDWDYLEELGADWLKSSLFYGSETWRLTENNKRRVEATEMDALRRSSKISRKERIRNVTRGQMSTWSQGLYRCWYVKPVNPEKTQPQQQRRLCRQILLPRARRLRPRDPWAMQLKLQQTGEGAGERPAS